MAKERRENKSRGRILRTGESQRPDGRYCYKYVDANGKAKFLYSWKLEPHDPLPKGKRPDISLREKEKNLLKDQLDGINHTGANMTVLDLYKRHINLNAQVKPNTQGSRERRVKRLQNDPLASMRIGNVKLSDAKAWALRQHEKGFAYHTIRTDKRALIAAFYAAIADDFIRKNPFDFTAVYWLTRSAAQGNSYAQFLLNHRQRAPSVLLCTLRLLHHVSNIFWETLPPPNPAGGHVESKLRQRIREKKITMGHNPDDHEEYQGPSMSM